MAEAVAVPNGSAPAVQPDAKPSEEAQAWAALMEEMEQDEGGEGEPPVQEPAKEGGEPVVKEPEQQAKPEPTPEELRTQIDNLNKAVKAERAEKQTLTQRLNTYDDFIRQLREGREQRQTQQRDPEPQQLKIPDINEDPIGHFQARTELLEKALQQAMQGTQHTAQQLQAQTEEQQFWAQVERSEVEERSGSPVFTVDGKQMSDYDLACRHLEATRVAELEMMLPDDSPTAIAYAQKIGAPNVEAVRAYMLNQDRIAVARHAMALGMSPAKLYFSLAKQRGYQSPTQQQPLDPKAKGKAQIEAARRGQQAAKTISGGAGKSAGNPASLQDLIDIYSEDPEEFDKQWEAMAQAGRLG